MRHYVCSVRDLKSELFSRPFYVTRPNEAIRSFQDEVTGGDSAQSLIAKHPVDFELWLLKAWDDESGDFDAYECERRLLCRGSDFAK